MKRIGIFSFLLLLVVSGCKTRQVQNSPFVEFEKGGQVISSEVAKGEYSTISGMIQDASTKEHIPFGKVTLWKAERIIDSTITNDDGAFRFDNVGVGTYVIQAAYVGYTSIQIDIRIEALKPVNLRLSMKMKSNVHLEKPVIYLYPTKNEQLTVSLKYDGEILHTYPAIEGTQWHVVAEPNGTLRDATGMEYYALFWEGRPNSRLTAPDGFIVAGKDVARFLEEKLEFLGLTRREANEFIMYWLPRMENNPFNLIHFASNDYERIAELKVTPIPETMIRVMMLTQPLTSPIDFPTQDLSQMKKTRCGFTVVEWGGCEMRMKGL